MTAPKYSGGREDRRARPFDMPGARMAEKIEEGVDRYRRGARADGDMRIADADEIDKKRRGENRTSAADQAEDESNQHARKQGGAVAVQKWQAFRSREPSFYIFINTNILKDGRGGQVGNFTAEIGKRCDRGQSREGASRVFANFARIACGCCKNTASPYQFKCYDITK